MPGITPMKRTSQHPPFSFAAPAYANAVPLAKFIPEVCPGAEVILDHPAELLKRLRNHHADAVLMPVADLFTTPGLDQIPGPGICADGRVRSVLLKCHRPLEQAGTLRLDPASRTSNTLALLLLRHYWKRGVRVVPGTDPRRADVEVVIGDRALCGPPASAGDIDLATAWKEFTGLPFVFAVWVFRRDHPLPDLLSDIVNRARQAGLEALPAIAREQALKLGLSEAACLEYFTACIRYDVGSREREAMDRFREMIARGIGSPDLSRLRIF